MEAITDIRKVLLVVNPISGAKNKLDYIKEVRKEVKKRNATLEMYRTTGEEDIFNLNKKIDKLNPCRIIVAGGDGTIKIVAEAIKDRQIPLGVIPAGSANGLAVNLKLPQTKEEQVKVAFGDNLMFMDVIDINGNYCLHMSDFGLNAELIRNYENSSIRGKIGYLLQSIPTLLESEYPFKFVIDLGDQQLEKEGILLAIANAQSYGTGATVNPEGEIDDGKFEILIFKNFDMLEILKTLRNEVELDPSFVEIISTTRAKISCKTPVAFQIDGEFIGERESIEAQILPHKILIASSME